MKRFLKLSSVPILALALVFGAAFTPFGAYEALAAQREVREALPSAHGVSVDGRDVPLFAFNIGGFNFFMLRDIAFLLNGTPGQFEIAWDGLANAINLIPGQPYTPVGTEFAGLGLLEAATAVPATAALLIDGQTAPFIRAYNINGSNFFMLRELGEVLGFGVDFDEESGTILIATGLPWENWDEDDDWWLWQNQGQSGPWWEVVVGTWDTIQIIGDAVFTQRVSEALKLIQTGAPEMWTWVLHYLGAVEQWSASGMWYWLNPPTYRIGTATYMASTIWLATTIIHDAYHSLQAHANPNVFDDPYSEEWAGAEWDAVRRQVEFLRFIDAPQFYIDSSEANIGTRWWLGPVTW